MKSIERDAQAPNASSKAPPLTSKSGGGNAKGAPSGEVAPKGGASKASKAAPSGDLAVVVDKPLKESNKRPSSVLQLHQVRGRDFRGISE